MTPQQIRQFTLAGNALFSLKSLKTNAHYTFKVERVMRRYKDNPTTAVPVEPPQWNVKVLSGRDNTRSSNYRFIGALRGEQGETFTPSWINGSHSYTAAAKGFVWCWRHLERCGERFEFAHAGRCGRCGRLLTVPSSIESGIGPECQDKMAFEAMGGAEGLLEQLFN